MIPMAIVTDGMWRKSLSVVRSLGKAGSFVEVWGDSLFTMSFWSRYVRSRVVCKTAKDDALFFLNKLIDNLERIPLNSRPVLFPMEDATINLISQHRNKLSEYADFLIPPAEALSIAQSKLETQRFAKELNVPVPDVYFFDDVDNLIEFIRKIKFKDRLTEFIVKPTTGSGSAGIIYLNEKKDINWRMHWEKYGALIIQERIPREGRSMGASLLFDKSGRCVASFAHARLKEYPNSGGPSTSRVSIQNEKLINDSIKLLSALNWRGVAMVEWKFDLKSQMPKLIEINPRFWGSLELAVRSGVDFPFLYALASKGVTNLCCHNYKFGVVCRWMLPGEILRFLTQDRSNRESIIEFFKGISITAEEWDHTDRIGSVLGMFCTIFSSFNPKYWKFLSR
jgi:predicted ATP-grasp superfamily ATP-dependent carboligase